MGLFDDVNFKMKCPVCNKIVDHFQSKDLSCGLNLVEVDLLSNFYSACEGCGAWIEFTRKIKEKDKELCDVLKDFDMNVTKGKRRII